MYVVNGVDKIQTNKKQRSTPHVAHSQIYTYNAKNKIKDKTKAVQIIINARTHQQLELSSYIIKLHAKCDDSL